MDYNFDKIIERRNTESVKWNWFAEDVLPMWVADMDFESPAEVLAAMQARIGHGVFGYGWPPDECRQVICDWLWQTYHWAVKPDELVFVPGLVSGFNAVCRAFGQQGGMLAQTPVYPPFLTAPDNNGMTLNAAPLKLVAEGQLIRYEIDYELFEAAITPQTEVFLLCNPHNPTGNSFSPAELERMAEICLKHELVICSDEIHCDLLLDDTQHTPLASLSPELAPHVITLMAPSKTFNLAGLGCGFAVVQNSALKKQLEQAMAGLVPHLNVLGITAAMAAYQHGQNWLTEVLAYLTANRNFAVDYLTREMPQLRTTNPPATYLLWLDCRESGIEGNPHEFFLEQAKVGLNDGAHFGEPGEGFVRLNFGCPRAQLAEGLRRMRDALQQL